MNQDELLAMVPEEKQKEAAEFLGTLDPLKTVTKDNAGDIVKQNEALKSYLDSRVTEGINTFKTNHLQKLLEEYHREQSLKEHPEETPEEKERRELRQKLENMEKSLERERKMRAITKTLTEAKVTMPEPILEAILETGKDETPYIAAYREHVEGLRKSIAKEIHNTDFEVNGISGIHAEGKPDTGLLKTKEAIAEHIRRNGPESAASELVLKSMAALPIRK